MAEPKRYFWLKLHKDFFKRKEIKRLRKIAGGDTYTIIYMEMLLRSIIDDGKLFFDGLEDDFAAELALDLDEDEENVKITMQYLLKTGLLEIRSEEEYYLPDTKDSTGSETSVAVRVRRHREKQKALQCNTGVTRVKQLCNGELEKELELEKEKELELEKDSDAKASHKKTAKRFVHPTIEEVTEYCLERNRGVDPERFYNYYESNGWRVGKNKMKDWQAAVRTWERNNYNNNNQRQNETLAERADRLAREIEQSGFEINSDVTNRF